MIRSAITVFVCLFVMTSTSFAANKKNQQAASRKSAAGKTMKNSNDPRLHDPNDIRNPAGQAKYAASKNGDTCPFANKSERVADNTKRIEPQQNNAPSKRPSKNPQRTNSVET